MDDGKLIQSTLQGNRRAFNDLVSAYHHPLIASAYHLTRNTEDAEDLVQETLLEAYRRLSDLRDTGKFKPWIFAILRNKCLRYLQRRRLLTESLEAYHETLPAPAPEDSSLLELMQQLSSPDQQILTARYLQGMNYGEIAGSLGISEQSARMRCLRARERLRLLVEQSEDELRRVLQYAFSAPASDRLRAAAKPVTGGLSMGTYLLRHHMTEGQQTTYRCEDILAMSGNDYLYVIRYDLVETVEGTSNDTASIAVAFPDFRIIRPPKERAEQEADLPVDTSTKIRMTLLRQPNGSVQDLQMHYTEGAFIAGMGEVIDASTRGIIFPDHPVQISERWEESQASPLCDGDQVEDYVWKSNRHQLTDVDMRDGRQYATIITKISHFMPVVPMWKPPEETETRGYGQTWELHVRTLFNITDGLLESRSYSGTVINDTWLLEPERRHLRHDIISVSGNADRIP